MLVPMQSLFKVVKEAEVQTITPGVSASRHGLTDEEEDEVGVSRRNDDDDSGDLFFILVMAILYKDEGLYASTRKARQFGHSNLILIHCDNERRVIGVSWHVRFTADVDKENKKQAEK